MSPLAIRKDQEAEGTAVMDDRRDDGRGAWMASSAQGRMPVAEDSRSEPSGHSAGEQRRARIASGAAAQTAAKRRKPEPPDRVPTVEASERLPGAKKRCQVPLW
jgi:hypothetical protein